MKTKTFVPKVWMKEIISAVKNIPLILKVRFRTEFIHDVKEYHSLNNYYWKRKRELAEQIAENAKYWLKDIEEIYEKESKLKIKLDSFPVEL